jgi:hypothetical protein
MDKMIENIESAKEEALNKSTIRITCPFCDFSKKTAWGTYKKGLYEIHTKTEKTIEDFEKKKKNYGHWYSDWSSYSIEIFQDDYITTKWQAYCNNCGITFIFNCNSSAEAYELWNNQKSRTRKPR